MRIDFVSPEQEIDPENDNVDVIVRLDDGRTFSLLVATPNNIYWCMDNEACDHYIGLPPLLVRRLSRNNVETAVQALLATPWFEIYSTRQSS